MQRFAKSVLCLTVAMHMLVAPAIAHSDGTWGETSTRIAPSWTPPESSPPEPKYAPDRQVDVQHLALDVTPDFDKRTISGDMTLTFKPIGKPLEEIKLDGIDLTVSSVKSNAAIAGHSATDKEIVVTFATPVPVGQETTLTISYSATPQYGLYFRTPSSGYPANEVHLFSQGEMIESRHWFPCFDHPNFKFTSELTCHVPDGMTVLSNGREMSKKKDADGKVAVRWMQDKPHVNYLITLVVGNFSKVEDKQGDIPLSFYTLPSDAPMAAAAFEPTKKAMAFFEKETGIPYPWAQYGQVVVRYFTQGGMENTTLTTLSEETLYPPDSENVYSHGGMYNFDGWYLTETIVSHELAHQWFGDLVTCKDWSNVWLNEGFAQFYSTLFVAENSGRDAMLYALYQDQQLILNAKDEKPVVYRRFKEPVEQFSNSRAYSKGSWVLHMLRESLGHDLFRQCIKTYLERFQYKTAVTQDLNNIVEELSGRSYDRFFDQWIYNSTIPDLSVNYEWDESEKLAKISVSQQQKNGEQRAKMQFPLDLRFKSKKGFVDRRVEVKELDEDFYVHLDAAPNAVRIDPNYVLLAKVDFRVPTHMLYEQLFDKQDTMGRIIAADLLGDKSDETTIAKLKECLNKDPFFGVRVKASEALRKIHSEEALDALIASTNQSDARARVAVIRDIGKFFHPKAMTKLLECLNTEKNSAIVASAIKGLGAYHKAEVRDALLKYVDSVSYRNRIADAAISTMRSQADISFIAPIREALVKHEDRFSSWGIWGALDAVAYLARNEKQKDDVRDFIAGYLNHKRTQIQTGAMYALGALEDPKAIPLLETFASSSKKSPQQSAAESAIVSLRNANKPNDNLKDLRDQVLDLQKTQRELKKDLDDLKKRLKANEPKKPEAKTDKTPAKPTRTSKVTGVKKS